MAWLESNLTERVDQSKSNSLAHPHCLYLLLYDYSQQIIDRVLFFRSVSNKKASFNPSVSTIDSDVIFVLVFA
ncbi:hypothetical protein VNO80_27677 [Phaseolus coccineus]|uniref:Uncharacterized protein n=1 Tax=Phaseolus coccineus TaxID=3886 RepID=A0AAN9LLL5_PHACN